MNRKCYNCGALVNIDPESAAEEFKQRFEGEDILESVVLCDPCNEERL